MDKRENFFKPWDIAVYAAVVILLACLVGWFFIDRGTQKDLTAIEIYYREQVFLVYSFEKDKFEQSEALGVECTILGEKGEYTITVTIGEGYNKVFIESDFAEIIEADCGGQECVENFPRITGGGDVIICLPHRIKVLGIGRGSNEVII